MNKKAQGISINTIIIAAIALAVLVVLFAIFTGRIGIFSRGVNEASSCKTTCDNLGMSFTVLAEKATCTSSSESRYLPGTYSDVVPPQICCCKPK